jgi:hypothetical protein
MPIRGTMQTDEVFEANLLRLLRSIENRLRKHDGQPPLSEAEFLHLLQHGELPAKAANGSKG